MTVSSNGTPTLKSTVFSGTTATVTPTAWPNTTAPAANDLILAVVTVYGTTTGALGATPGGWTLVNQVVGTARAVTAYYTKTATGSDSFPTFNGAETGTAADAVITCVLYDLSDSGGSTPIVWTDGAQAGTSGTLTANCGGMPAGSFVIAATVAAGASATTTWTVPGTFTLDVDQTALGFAQTYCAHQTTAPTAGAASTHLFTHGRVSTYQSGMVIGIAPPGSAGLQQFSFGPAFTATTNTVTTVTAIPMANATMVALVGIGNGAAAAATGFPVTGTGGTWTQLKASTDGAYGLASVWAHDAGASPSTQTVTVTAAPTTVVDPLLQVIQFLGAGTTAQQATQAALNAVATSNATTNTVTITPAKTGSQIVGATGSDTDTLLTAGTSSNFLSASLGSGGDSRALFEGNVWTTASSNQTVGASANIAESSVVGVEIIPAPAAANPAPLHPLHAPVRAQLARQGTTKGHGGHLAGAFSGTGPSLKGSLQQPIRAPIPLRQRKPPRGHGGKSAGTVSGVGPRLRAPVRPVLAQIRRGEVITGAVVSTSTPLPVAPVAVTGGRVTPRKPAARGRAGGIAALVNLPAPALGLPQPAVPVLPYRPPPGRGRYGRVTGAAPAAQPAATTRPLTGPVRARLPLPPRGHGGHGAGIFSGTGLPAAPVRQPATPALRPLPPAGKITTRRGVFSGTGPAVRPLTAPVKARQPLPLRGHAGHGGGVATGTGLPAPALHQPAGTPRTLPPRGRILGVYRATAAAPPAPGPPHPFVARKLPARAILGRGGLAGGIIGPAVPSFAPPRSQPWRSPIPHATRGGTVLSRTGVFSGTGPQVTPLSRPVRASLPAMPALKGRTEATRLAAAPFIPATGPQLYPLHSPVRARQPLPPRGHGGHGTGMFSTSGPPVYPLTAPVKARRPLPPRGRVLGVYRAVVLPPAPDTGPPLTPLHQPVRARQPLPPRGHGGHGTGVFSGTGYPVAPLHQPVHGRLPLPPAGKTITRRGLPSGVGPTVRPLIAPVRARQPLPPRGHGGPGQGILPVAGLTAAPLHSPVRARQPLPPRGSIAHSTGMFSGTGPQLAPLHQPVRAVPAPPRRGLVASTPVASAAPSAVPPRSQPWRSPQQVRPRSGYIRSSRAPAGQEPAPAPLHSPIAAHRIPPPAGRALGITRAAPPKPPTGPQLYPLHGPIQARRPKGPGGYAALGVYRAVVLPPPQIPGPPIPPRAQPWRATLPAPYQHGISITFIPPPPSAQPPIAVLFGSPQQQLQWAGEGARTGWEAAAQPGRQWSAGGARFTQSAAAGQPGWPSGPARNQP